jgi:HTH-type transcriptional regulator, sugar sensing transcriptional regulator
MMEKIERVLENLGFSPNEIKVYLTLNDHGSSKAGKVSKIAKIDRSSCYNSLKSLQEKGLVSYVLIGPIKWFQATGPKRLMDYIKEQEEDLKEILPELNARHKASKIKGQVRLFKGVKGVRSIFQDIIRGAKKENLVFGSESQLEEKMPTYQKQFVRQLKENNILVREIVREDRSTKTSNPKQTRYISKSIESPVVTNIYGDKIALIIWTDEPEGIIIENEAAAKAYRGYFKFMWENAKK